MTIKVTTISGSEYSFEADYWQVAGSAVAIYKGSDKIAEFSSFLIAQRVPDPVAVEPEVVPPVVVEPVEPESEPAGEEPEIVWPEEEFHAPIEIDEESAPE